MLQWKQSFAKPLATMSGYDWNFLEFLPNVTLLKRFNCRIQLDYGRFDFALIPCF